MELVIDTFSLIRGDMFFLPNSYGVPRTEAECCRIEIGLITAVYCKQKCNFK
jgi:hypothetical protein